MAAQKLFGNSASAKFSKKQKNRKKKKSRSLRPLKGILIFLLVVEILYCIAIFSPIPFVVRLRNMYIETAMSTMSHRWLATAFIPKDIVDEVVSRVQEARENQQGMNSTWDTQPVETVAPETTVPEETSETEPDVSPEQEAFFSLFWELDQDSMLTYIDQHPEVWQTAGTRLTSMKPVWMITAPPSERPWANRFWPLMQKIRFFCCG